MMEAENLRQRGQRGVGVICAIVAIVIIGLIVYGIIYYGSSGLSTAEIKQHPEKYLGKTITIEGWYIGGNYISSTNPANVHTEGETVEYLQQILSVSLPRNMQVFEGANYRFTGAIITTNEFGQLTVKLDVSKVEPV